MDSKKGIIPRPKNGKWISTIMNLTTSTTITVERK